MPPGRNDPCPCGSGRKYKKCCLGRESAAAAEARAPWTSDDRDRALDQLDRFLERDDMEEARQNAFALFWGPLLEPLAQDHAERLLELPTSQLACAYWTMFDFRLDDDERVVDRFLDRFPRPLGAGERRWLEAMRDSSVRLWELHEVQPGEGFTALDVWEGRRVVRVREGTGSEELVRWDLLAARLVEVSSGLHEIEGPLLVLPQTEKKPLVTDLRRHRRRIAKESPQMDEAAFFEVMFPLIHDHWVQAVGDARPPRLVTAEGDPMLIARVVFDVHDRDALRSALDADSRFEPDADDEAETGDPPSWTWLAPGKRGEDRRALGRVELAERLTLEAHSRSRAESGRALLEGLAPGAIRHRATSFEDPLPSAKRPPPPSADEPEPGPPSEEQARLMQEIKDQHYRRWVDESIPALGGRTPREAARLKSARPQLVALLKGLESMEERAGRAGQPVYDATWIWRELGLRRPKTDSGK